MMMGPVNTGTNAAGVDATDSGAVAASIESGAELAEIKRIDEAGTRK